VVALVDVSETQNANIRRDDNVENLIRDLSCLASGDLEEVKCNDTPPFFLAQTPSFLSCLEWAFLKHEQP
jgi:hypothetical protein